MQDFAFNSIFLGKNTFIKLNKTKNKTYCALSKKQKNNTRIKNMLIFAALNMNNRA